MTEAWNLTIDLSSRSFPALKDLAARLLKEVSSAKSYKHLPIMAGDSEGNGYRFTVTCPTEARIIELRREADELENKLKNGQ